MANEVLRSVEFAGNGHEAIAWRDAAINEALRGFNNDEGLDALVHAIRAHRPEAAMQIVWVERQQMLRFLQAHPGFSSLLTGRVDHEEDDVLLPYVGWYGCEWEGSTVEIAVTPSLYNGQIVCLGDHADAVDCFARALHEFSIRPTGRCLTYAQGWENAPDLDAEIGKVTWDDITLEAEVLRSVRTSVEAFYHHKDAYAALGFPWRRGILLVGPPGTGKTMVCKAVAATLPDWPFLYVRDLREDGDTDAIEAIFKRARELAPCILVFEDIDGLVNDCNRTVFLNELDGFRNNEGLLIMASSNHPGKIDEALLKRPSRFDRVVRIGLPKAAERRAYCVRLLSRSALAERLAPGLDTTVLAHDVAKKTDRFTPAYLKEAFVAAALHCAHEGITVLDERFAAAVLQQVDELRTQMRRMRDPDALAEMRGDDDVIGFRSR